VGFGVTVFAAQFEVGECVGATVDQGDAMVDL